MARAYSSVLGVVGCGVYVCTCVCVFLLMVLDGVRVCDVCWMRGGVSHTLCGSDTWYRTCYITLYSEMVEMLSTDY